MIQRIIIAVTVPLLLLTATAFSTEQRWTIDPVHSSVRFSVKYMVLTDVVGRFKEFDAKLIKTGDDFRGARLEATIKTASIDTDNERRDNHLRSADFFDVEKFPEITFLATSFNKIDEQNYTIEGDLTIRGVTRPVVLATKFAGAIIDPWENLRAAFTASTTIDRHDFGLEWNRPLQAGGWLVGRQVTITLDVQFILQKDS